MSKSQRFLYGCLRAFNEKHYAGLLSDAHIIGGRIQINLGTKDDPDYSVVYPLRKTPTGKIWALPQEHLEALPIMVTKFKKDVAYNQKVYEYITEYKSAKFREERVMGFRQLVDELCCFEHSSPIDFILWKIIVLAGVCGRLVCRVSSQPGFGKDSVVNVIGDLCGTSVIVHKPTMAKLKYVLTNKLVMLNELANLKGDDREAMESFLLATGALSNVFENNSRSVEGTKETYNIGKLSLLLTYNDKACYPENYVYFDDMFNQAVPDRFIPFQFKGRITEQLNPNPPNAAAIADQNAEYYKSIVRTIMWYRNHWYEEIALKPCGFKCGAERGLPQRWASNFDTISHFITLYSENAKENAALLETLYDRHLEYQKQIRGADPFGGPKFTEELIQ